MFEIQVKGQPFTYWESATFSASIDENCGKFSFTASNATPATYPVKAGDPVQINIDGVPRITGFVDVISAAMDDGQSTVSVQGRDSICDLIDSSVPDSAKKITAPTSIKNMADKIINSLGASIGVVNQVGDVSDITGEILASSGQSCMDFLASFARKKQVYFISSGDGNLIVYRPGEVLSKYPILNKANNNTNNIKGFSVSFRQDKRFNLYKATSQDNMSDDGADYKAGGVSRAGTSEDEQIRKSRYIEFQGEESMSDAEASERAKEEANVRRARAIEYTCTTQGAKYNMGELVQLDDDFAGLHGVYLIRSIEVRGELSGGSVTTLTLALPDAYKVQGELIQSTKRRASTGDQLQNKTPPTEQRFIR